MGKVEGPYIVHGAVFNVEDIDIWGGFWELGTCEGRIVVPEVGSWTFEGNFLWDRAYHRVYYSESAWRAAGAPLSFSCFGIFHPEFDIMVTRSVNPSPIESPVPFQHQGRLNFHARGMDFSFDEFFYDDNGGMQPDEHYLTGTYPGGEVNLTGDVFIFYPNDWEICSGVWWDTTAFRDWGRAFIIWTGTVTLYGDTIHVDDAWGVGEFTRFATETTEVSENETAKLPSEIDISVYPNPFNSSCVITAPAGAEVEIYDMRGGYVCKLFACSPEEGDGKRYRYAWTPSSSCTSGVYFVKVTPKDGGVMVRRVVYLR